MVSYANDIFGMNTNNIIGMTTKMAARGGNN
jgi:hypothetical protein